MVSITNTTATFRIGDYVWTIYRCYGCCEWFDPGTPWDNYCDPCWEREQARMVMSLAEREGDNDYL